MECVLLLQSASRAVFDYLLAYSPTHHQHGFLQVIQASAPCPCHSADRFIKQWSISKRSFWENLCMTHSSVHSTSKPGTQSIKAMIA